MNEPVNIGLQWQYPLLWWIDAVLGGLMVVGLAWEIIVSPRITKSRKLVLEAEFKAKKSKWDARKAEKELELSKSPSDREVSHWYEPEPKFEYRLSELRPAPVFGIIAISAAIALFFVGLGTIIASVPFDSKYYNLYTVSGQVSDVVSAVQVSKDTVSSDFTVALAGDPRRYAMEDARIKTLQGERVTLLCRVGWNNQAADSWTCELRSYDGSTR